MNKNPLQTEAYMTSNMEVLTLFNEDIKSLVLAGSPVLDLTWPRILCQCL